MYEREISDRPPRARRRRRRKQPSPALAAFLLAAILLTAAYVLSLEKPDEDQDGVTLPISSLSAPSEPGEAEEPANAPGLAPDPRGEEPVPPETSSIDKDSWYLMLVNPWNPLPEDYTFTLKDLPNGHSVDERCYDDLTAMLDACEAEGLSPLICSSYRSQSKQEALYQNKVERLVSQGWSREDAKVEAAKVVAIPGTSEHQLGLAVDIVDVNNQLLDASQERTDVQQWLIAHSWEYGFILRYPNDKSDITGIIYEPWHYRYVGKETAKEIHELGVCLEEYLDMA